MAFRFGRTRRAPARRMRKRMARRPKMRMVLRRRLGNPTPTFVETFKFAEHVVTAAAPYLDAWKVRISQIPQIADYQALYTQYRINWVQHILIPAYNSAEVNQGLYNGGVAFGNLGQPRIAYAIQDSPNVGVPANENDVLEDNGCKLKTIHNVFKVSQRPVPDVAEFSNAAGATVYTKQKYKQFFNFAALGANDPNHGAIQVALTLPGLNAAMTFYHYVKVSFTLRDAK